MKIPAKGFTHGGKFHADDVFSTALLQILRPDIQITRGFTVLIFNCFTYLSVLNQFM